MQQEEGKQEGTPPTGEEAKVAEPSKAENLLDEAKATADRIEAANEKYDELLQRQEELKATEVLSGQADAGQVPKPKETEDEKWAKEAKERYAGTGMDPTPTTTDTGAA